MEKICISCKELKPFNQFSPSKTATLGITARCKKCRCVQAKAWRAKNPDKAKAIAERAKPKQKEYYLSGAGKLQSRIGLLKRYNLTQHEYDNILLNQRGVCGICKNFETRNRTKNLSVDHCHKTGRVRGLLCAKCNSALGHMEDNITYLLEAVNYLNKQNYDKI